MQNRIAAGTITHARGALPVPENKKTVTVAERAEEQAKRIPWRGLLQARNEYVESECFVFWLRSIEESAGYLPDRVWKTIEDQYPVFLGDDIPYLERHGNAWVWKIHRCRVTKEKRIRCLGNG